MIQPDTPERRRLFKLLDKIIGEERSFKISVQDDHQFGNLQAAIESEGMADELERIRLTHEAILEVHRKFLSDHELMIERCLAISRQVRAGLLNESEMTMEAERLQGELKRIKQEHSLVQQEYQKILAAQSQSLKNLDWDS